MLNAKHASLPRGFQPRCRSSDSSGAYSAPKSLSFAVSVPNPKTHMVKDDNGKNKVVTDQFSTPIFNSKFIYELLLNLETYAKNGQGGFRYVPRKITHPSLATLLPKENEQVGIAHGTALAAWCAGTTTAKPVTTRNFTRLEETKKPTLEDDR